MQVLDSSFNQIIQFVFLLRCMCSTPAKRREHPVACGRRLDKEGMTQACSGTRRGRCRDEMVPFVATGMTCESIRASESVRWKRARTVKLHSYVGYKTTSNKQIQNHQTHRHRQQTGGTRGEGGWRKGKDGGRGPCKAMEGGGRLGVLKT